MAETEMPYTKSTGSPTDSYIKAGIVIAVGFFLALFVVTEDGKTAATVMLLFSLAGAALLVGWMLGHKSATRATEIQSASLGHMVQMLQMQQHAPPQLSTPSRVLLPPGAPPPIAPGFERPANIARIMLADGTLPEVDLDLMRAFLDECFPDCNRQRWRHENAAYGEIAGVLCNMRGAPLVEGPPNRYKWQQGVTREMLEGWYARVMESGRD